MRGDRRARRTRGVQGRRAHRLGDENRRPKRVRQRRAGHDRFGECHGRFGERHRRFGERVIRRGRRGRRGREPASPLKTPGSKIYYRGAAKPVAELAAAKLGSTYAVEGLKTHGWVDVTVVVGR